MAYEARLTEDAEKFLEKHGMDEADGFGALAQSDPELGERFCNFAFGEVPQTVELDDETRYLGWLATLLGCQGLDAYRVVLASALKSGALTTQQAREVLYQSVAYLGMGRVLPFVKATDEAFEQAGVELPLAPAATTEPTEESRLAGGEQAQIGCFGEVMAGYKDKGNPDYPHVNKFLVDNCFGDWYTREGLDLRQRELVTFCLLAAQGGCESQIRGHANGNKHVGNSKNLMVRVVESNLPFIGYPRSLNALKALDDVYGMKHEQDADAPSAQNKED